MLCYAMVSYAMLCYVKLCYAMLCYAMRHSSTPAATALTAPINSASSERASKPAAGAQQRGHRATADANKPTTEDAKLQSSKVSFQDFLDPTPRLSAEEAARRLGAFLGCSLPPAATVALPAQDIGRVLEALQAGDKELEAALFSALQAGDKELEAALFSHADAVTTRIFGPEVYFRGLVEFSNVCSNDCAYCGIRKHAPAQSLKRYTMSVSEVVEIARWAFTQGMGTLMLQGGELRTPSRVEYLEDCIRQVRAETLTPEQYQRLYDAGARRYLLRIETTNASLYEKLHPDGRRLASREQCLRDLRRIGFQVGTGVMVGLPGQTLSDLAADIEWFRLIGANMVGMGPYITAEGTPAAEWWEKECPEGQSRATRLKQAFELTTRCNALVRTTLEGVHITATTALQAIEPNGRELALRRGCNVLMPILTPTRYRENYQLYKGKPCITDTAAQCRNCLNLRVSMVGKKIVPGVWADAPNFRSRKMLDEERDMICLFTTGNHSNTDTYRSDMPRSCREQKKGQPAQGIRLGAVSHI
eukprot:g78986.t1